MMETCRQRQVRLNWLVETLDEYENRESEAMVNSRVNGMGGTLVRPVKGRQ